MERPEEIGSRRGDGGGEQRRKTTMERPEEIGSRRGNGGGEQRRKTTTAGMERNGGGNRTYGKNVSLFNYLI